MPEMRSLQKSLEELEEEAFSRISRSHTVQNWPTKTAAASGYDLVGEEGSHVYNCWSHPSLHLPQYAPAKRPMTWLLRVPQC